MNGPHDMGGMQCYGPVIPETDEPIFHGEWEKKALALTVAMGFTGMWNIDISRHARETLPPDFYLSKTYYQIWLAGLEKLMLELGMVSQEELGSGSKTVEPVETKRTLSGSDTPDALALGGPVERESNTKPAFQPGQQIITRNINPVGHTRLPRYARGKAGVIKSIQGFHVYPDSNSSGDGENPQWLYSVEFEARELFGPEAEAGNMVMVDCWEPYLESA